MSNEWFEVDKGGLAKLIADRGKIFLLHELLQNCWDEEGVTTVNVTLTPIPGRPVALLKVTDDSPEGFKNMSNAWTMYAESDKKSQPEKRGRFNLGEKLVLALCNYANITSTKGCVRFQRDGKRDFTTRQKTQKGTEFVAEVPITRAELDKIEWQIKLVNPPASIVTRYNGVRLEPRPLVHSFEATLPTTLADEEGVMRTVVRKTLVSLYECGPDDNPRIYEMGIPVVETGDHFHVDVHQKVPLNMDRDNVLPSYLRTLRVEVLNHTSHLMTKERAASTEVQEATSDERISPDVVDRMLTQRFGEKRFIYDPSDPEANNNLVAQGYTPIMGGSLNGNQWENVRRDTLARPAHELAPTPKPYSAGGTPEKIIPESDWTQGMIRQVTWIKQYAKALELGNIHVRITCDISAYWSANYCPGSLALNLGKLGHKWFNEFPDNLPQVIDLMIHEFGHHFEGNHLSDDYFRALSKLGARSTMLALKSPDLFKVPPPSYHPERETRDDTAHQNHRPGRPGAGDGAHFRSC